MRLQPRERPRPLDDIAFRLEQNRWESHLATLVVPLHHLLCGVSGYSPGYSERSSCEIDAACFDGYVIHDGTVPARYCLLQKSKNDSADWMDSVAPAAGATCDETISVYGWLVGRGARTAEPEALRAIINACEV